MSGKAVSVWRTTLKHLQKVLSEVLTIAEDHSGLICEIIQKKGLCKLNRCCVVRCGHLMTKRSYIISSKRKNKLKTNRLILILTEWHKSRTVNRTYMPSFGLSNPESVWPSLKLINKWLPWLNHCQSQDICKWCHWAI